MKILVTGANGYLGQGVVKALLDNGHSVVAADFKTNYVDLPQKTGRNERTGDCRTAEQRERAGSQRVQTAVWSELSQWVQSWHSCKVAGDSGASDSKK